MHVIQLECFFLILCLNPPYRECTHFSFHRVKRNIFIFRNNVCRVRARCIMIARRMKTEDIGVDKPHGSYNATLIAIRMETVKNFAIFIVALFAGPSPVHIHLMIKWFSPVHAEIAEIGRCMCVCVCLLGTGDGL